MVTTAMRSLVLPVILLMAEFEIENNCMFEGLIESSLGYSKRFS